MARNWRDVRAEAVAKGQIMNLEEFQRQRPPNRDAVDAHKARLLQELELAEDELLARRAGIDRGWKPLSGRALDAVVAELAGIRSKRDGLK